MMTSSTSLPSNGKQGRDVPGWMRSISPRRAGITVLILALLFAITSYILQSKLNYPEILIDKASFANSLVAQGEIAALLGFVGLLLCGVLLLVVSLSLEQYLKGKRGVTGGLAGALWVVAALLGLALVPLWGSAAPAGVQVLATIILVLAEVVAPLLLAFWTVTLALQLRAYRALALVGAIGLLLVFLCSLAWVLNALLPLESGFYTTAGILAILALLGESFWLAWLLLLGFRLISRREETIIAAQQVSSIEREEQDKGRMKRRGFLKFGAGLGIGIAGGAFVLVRTGLTITGAPPLESDDVPSEPSLLGTLFYLIELVALGLNPITTVLQMRAITQSGSQPLPAGVSLGNVNASGVQAQLICAPGAVKSRVILVLNGGGWAIPINDKTRIFAARLSQSTSACVLVPAFRLSPEHPFPAALSDCVTVYRWLLHLGVASSQVVIVGGSAGGNLTLATAVALRESGDALPAALVALSPPTDLAMTGETYRTKASVDPILGKGLAQNAYATYTGNGATDVRNPLVSPLYADLHGFPPTFLQVGTQEVLLSDSIRFAQRAQAAGVEVKLEIWPGMFHGWQDQGDFLPEARLAYQHMAKYIRRHLGA